MTPVRFRIAREARLSQLLDDLAKRFEGGRVVDRLLEHHFVEVDPDHVAVPQLIADPQQEAGPLGSGLDLHHRTVVEHEDSLDLDLVDPELAGAYGDYTDYGDEGYPAASP